MSKIRRFPMTVVVGRVNGLTGVWKHSSIFPARYTLTAHHHGHHEILNTLPYGIKPQRPKPGYRDMERTSETKTTQPEIRATEK